MYDLRTSVEIYLSTSSKENGIDELHLIAQRLGRIQHEEQFQEPAPEHVNVVYPEAKGIRPEDA